MDVNVWLSQANAGFLAFKSKVIAYAGALKPVANSLTPGGAILRIGAAKDNHERLEFSNEAMLYGLNRRFGISDGMVPYDSALLCDAGQWLIDASNTTFVCGSPTRVRRFEPGVKAEMSVDDQTLSITRRPRGYDHEDMRSDPDVLNWVIKDLNISYKIVVSTSLQVSPAKGPYVVGQDLGGTFTITNRGNAELTTRQVLIAGRVGNTCPNKVCPDFTIRDNIKLGPGQTYSYSGNFKPAVPGTYTISVAYQTPDGNWVNPVDTEKGTINKLELVVPIPPPTLTSSNPSSLGASPNSQNVILNGTGLSRILYCRVKAPDGKFTFIYIPLSQVIGGSDAQLHTRIRFLTRGTYYVSAFTMDKGHSNDLPIEVR